MAGAAPEVDGFDVRRPLQEKNEPVMLKKTPIIALIAITLAGLAGLWFMQAGTLDKAPASRFVLLDGSVRTESDLQGKVTLVNFWATSCTTCVAEMPALMATDDKFRSRGYQTVAVAMSYDPPSYVVNFAQTRKLPFAVAIDNTGANAKAWGDVGITPTSYLVDKRGQIVKRYVGAPEMAELHKLIEKLLAEA
jgi:peroxiredoxin